MNIAPMRLDRAYQLHQAQYEAACLRVLRSGRYVLGEELSAFEAEFAAYIGSPYAVGLGTGLDALWIAFRLLGIGAGDEVIVQANAYIACVMGITINNATPVFVEPDEYYNMDTEKIEAAITDKTKAILAVHLYGQASDMETILAVAQKHNLSVVEDCAQSHGAKQGERMMGTFGNVGCFSMYPSKMLGAFGEAGAIVTDAETLAGDFRVFRNYGSEKRYYNKMIGTNSRLDELQAALLRVRLLHLDELIAERERLCARYRDEITNAHIILPKIRPGCSSVWHQFVVRSEERERLIEHLAAKGVGSIIHYPVPPHLSEAYAYLGLRRGSFPLAEAYADTVLSLPLYNGMTEAEQTYTIEVINDYNP